MVLDLHESSVIALHLFIWFISIVIILWFLFGVFIFFEDMREKKLIRCSRLEWFTIEQNDILSLQSSDENGSDNDKFYRYALSIEQGIQIKQTNQTFPDIPISNIFIHETDTSKPYYAYQEVKYTDFRIKQKPEKKRLIFFVPKGTVQNLFRVT